MRDAGFGIPQASGLQELTGWLPYKLIIPSVAWALKLSQPTPTRASGRPELNKLALAATSLVVDSTRPHRKRKEIEGDVRSAYSPKSILPLRA